LGQGGVLADHCHLMAETHLAATRAGFSHVDSENRGFGPKLDPSGHTFYGIATR